MPRILDNLTSESSLLRSLRETLALSHRADICVGYFNLRGWRRIADTVDAWPVGPDQRARVLIGMQRLPHDELRQALSFLSKPGIDNREAHRLKLQLAEELREQLAYGIPTAADEAGLKQLLGQLRSGRVAVKLFLRHSLHAKLYLCFRDDPVSPVVGYLGSSNLTFAGLLGQGELNVDVLDQDACQKLGRWFEDRWNDRYCVDITPELVSILENSWARPDLLQPYHIYLKMAYHLSHEARAGLAEFKIPTDFEDRLFDFQAAAVKIAAHHLNKRGGVLIGDVVGLGKTLMATALARIFEDDHHLETLIICPKNLVAMWEDYAHEYRLRARVLSLSRVIRELPNTRRYRLLVIDESHNLRNREGRRYRAIQEYIRQNESKCILLSATPYNKTYLDLSSQLRLFVPDDTDLGIRPEHLLREMGEVDFSAKHQAGPRTLAAFEVSEHADDWRELMRLYLVRRTRTFIQANYSDTDAATDRKYLTYENGDRSYLPTRVPKTIGFQIDEDDSSDQYASLYSQKVVDVVAGLRLPRYGLGNYIIAESSATKRTADEKALIRNLSRAGQRLKGFCRTNLFKRLESSGHALLQSLDRHILRNHVFLHAVESGRPLPIGPQDAEMLDSRFVDEDTGRAQGELFDAGDGEEPLQAVESERLVGVAPRSDHETRAAAAYEEYRGKYQGRFGWLRPDLFTDGLAADLRADTEALLDVQRRYGDWDPGQDIKLSALRTLLTETHPNDKVLVFSQFADTVRYLERELAGSGLQAIEGVTGTSAKPTEAVWRFSPASNGKRELVSRSRDGELRVLIATDVLSEGQNLQDCSIVVNYDLPWAIIRLIQRAGRVDRIGQQADAILCYSFLPADGVERIIQLRSRVKNRLRENAEVVGADEAFFEGDADRQTIVNLYNERAGVLDDEADAEVDLASHAYQIWKNAITADPSLEQAVADLPDVVFSSRRHTPSVGWPEGVLVFARTAEGTDALAYVGRDGKSVTESQREILAAAECAPDAVPQRRDLSHHELVEAAVRHVVKEEKGVGGQLGRPSGARYRTYVRLKGLAGHAQGSLLAPHGEALRRALDDIYSHPLRPAAVDALNRQLRSGADDHTLAHLVVTLRDENQLCVRPDEVSGDQPPRIICSLGLFSHTGDGQ